MGWSKSSIKREDSSNTVNGNISFLWLSNIPSCMCACVCVCVYIYISHIFFIHLSVYGHLGCFHILTIVNNAAMNIGVHVYFQVSGFVFFWYIPRNGIAGSYSSSIFKFLRNRILFSTVAAPITFHQQCTRVPFLHILTNICHLCSFWWCHSDIYIKVLEKNIVLKKNKNHW